MIEQPARRPLRPHMLTARHWCVAAKASRSDAARRELRRTARKPGPHAATRHRNPLAVALTFPNPNTIIRSLNEQMLIAKTTDIELQKGAGQSRGARPIRAGDTP